MLCSFQAAEQWLNYEGLSAMKRLLLARTRACQLSYAALMAKNRSAYLVETGLLSRFWGVGLTRDEFEVKFSLIELKFTQNMGAIKMNKNSHVIQRCWATMYDIVRMV